MKNKPASQSVLIGLFAVLTFALCSSPAQATSTTWTGTSGSWFTGTNWSNGVPTSTTDASINNAGKAEISSSGAVANTLTLGYDTGDSGTVSVDASAADLNVTWGISVGDQGTGTLNISNGGSVESIGENYIAALQGEFATSDGSVTVTGSGSIWQIGNVDKLSSRLFVSGTENGDGGTALLSITSGGTVQVYNNSTDHSVAVGSSGTLTGNGILTTPSEPTVDVFGTLAPNWTLTIGASGDTSNLKLESSATTQCNVTPGNLGSVDVSVSGTATLNGRVSVTMTGTFTAGTQFTLLHADGGRSSTFSSVSITYPSSPTYTPVITYDTNNVYLYLRPN
jgi:fibronectin-binding autotransporter adhesin